MANASVGVKLDLEAMSHSRRSYAPMAIGGALGAGFWAIVVIGVLQTVFTRDHVLGRVMGDWESLGSFTAFGMAMAALAARRQQLRRELHAFALDLLPADQETLILPEDALEQRKRLRTLDDATKTFVLIRLFSAALQRARANWSAQDVGDAVKTQAELLQGQSDSEYAIVRYLAWAIPSIGFIGTIRGLGTAIGAFKPTSEAVTSISSATVARLSPMELACTSLNTAFDTTLVALVLSLILMYFVYRVQADDDALIVRATNWCMQRFVFRMHIPKETQS